VEKVVAAGKLTYTATAEDPNGKTWTDVKEKELSGTAVQRIYGDGRYETGMLIAEQLRKMNGKFPAVVVAFGGNFPDALAGSYRANRVGAPILLISDKYADMVCSFIDENMVPNGTIYILGGTGVVTESVEAKLTAISENVVRLAGDNRFGTNLEILKEAGVSAGEEILVCIGDNFADSLSVSSTGKAILLVKKGGLTAEQKEYLSGLGGNSFTILGGPGVITEAVEEELKAYGDVDRVYGASRYETSTMIAERYFPNAEAMVIAIGTNFPDGLSVGSLAYALHAPLVLTTDKNLAAAKAFAETLDLTKGIAIGGSGLLSDETVMAIFGLESADQIEVIH
jgi:putative cell wall-binding protein